MASAIHAQGDTGGLGSQCHCAIHSSEVGNLAQDRPGKETAHNAVGMVTVGRHGTQSAREQEYQMITLIALDKKLFSCRQRDPRGILLQEIGSIGLKATSSVATLF